MYQVIIRQYEKSVSVGSEAWELPENDGVQEKVFTDVPVRVTVRQEAEESGRVFYISAQALADCKVPVSVSLEAVKENWRGDEYVFFPAAVYDGNRMESRSLPYPPFCAQRSEEGGWTAVITDIPRFGTGDKAKLQLLSGDMSTPAAGYYSSAGKEGFLILHFPAAHTLPLGDLFYFRHPSGRLSMEIILRCSPQPQRGLPPERGPPPGKQRAPLPDSSQA